MVDYNALLSPGANPGAAFTSGYAAGQNILANKQQMSQNALAENRQQQAFDQQRRDKFDAKQHEMEIAAASAMAYSPRPKADAERFYPEFVANLKASGQWDAVTDDQVREHAQAELRWARAQAGEETQAPVQQMETIQGPDGAILQRDPANGSLKQVLGRGIQRQEVTQMTPYQAAQVDIDRQKLALEKQKASNPNATQKTSDVERTAAGFLGRMSAAEPLIGSYQPSTKDYIAYGRLLNGGSTSASLANSAMSNEGQKYYQAANDWVRAKLRKESGAVISPMEMEQEIRTYFPVPGDGPDVIAQKAASRLQAVEAMKGMAGPAANISKSQPTKTATGPNGQKIGLIDGKWVPL